MITIGRARIRDHLDIVEKARSKLAGLKADSLSMAGKLVLVQSVLQAIPVHVFHPGGLDLKGYQ